MSPIPRPQSGHLSPQPVGGSGTPRMAANARARIYLGGIVVAGLCYWAVSARESSPGLSAIRLTVWFGFIAAAGLYVALAISPVSALFPGAPARGLLLEARRAIGVSAWAFAALHSLIGFRVLLGGWSGLAFISPARLADVILSGLSLLILSVLALTSNNRTQALLGKRWRSLHRLIHAAAVLSLLHMVAVGSHFLKWGISAFVLAAMVIVLLGLQWIRWITGMAGRNGR